MNRHCRRTLNLYKRWGQIALNQSPLQQITSVPLRAGLQELALAGIVQGFLSALYYMVVIDSVDLAGALIILVATPIGYGIGTIIFAGLLAGLAKTFKGTVRYKRFAGSVCRVSAAIAGTWFALLSALTIIVGSLGIGKSLIPVVALLGIVASFYWLYLIVRITKAMNRFGKAKAVGVVLVVAVVLALALQALVPAV